MATNPKVIAGLAFFIVPICLVIYNVQSDTSEGEEVYILFYPFLSNLGVFEDLFSFEVLNFRLKMITTQQQQQQQQQQPLLQLQQKIQKAQ